MSAIRSSLKSLRHRVAAGYVRRRLQRPTYTLISDDCWAGRLYGEYEMPCTSPFVSMGFTPCEYITVLELMREPGALDILEVSAHLWGYPILHTRHARLFGQHYKTAEDFIRKFERRRRLIDWETLRIKIDLGRRKYQPEDITRWNALRLPNSVAFHPDTPHYREAKIHHGIAVPDWIEDGSHMFQRSCRVFDVIGWLNHGVPRQSRFAGLVHRLLFDHG
ncbi:MAG: DUF1919 domain-containing protein [Opitutaceae bacterium]|nr:DUF1919 domain-containing protein [Cephaloticoccus sp.]MCP5530073.1 DUF1919 domain-containing protein [Opitutaceae bacterium]